MADQVGAPGITTVANEAHTLVPSEVPSKLLCVRVRDGYILSIQPGSIDPPVEPGKQEYRVPPNDGPFEQCELVGSALVYDYTWNGARWVMKVAWAGAVDAK